MGSGIEGLPAFDCRFEIIILWEIPAHGAGTPDIIHNGHFREMILAAVGILRSVELE